MFLFSFVNVSGPILLPRTTVNPRPLTAEEFNSIDVAFASIQNIEVKLAHIATKVHCVFVLPCTNSVFHPPFPPPPPRPPTFSTSCLPLVVVLLLRPPALSLLSCSSFASCCLSFSVPPPRGSHLRRRHSLASCFTIVFVSPDLTCLLQFLSYQLGARSSHKNWSHRQTVRPYPNVPSSLHRPYSFPPTCRY